MYKYHCLNPISPVGMGQLDANYENTENAADADVILVRSAKMHEMEFGENLKAIARAGAGVNNIPLDRCAEEGIVVFNTPGANANGVKELVIAGMLLAARDIVGGINWVKGYDEDGDIAKAAEKKKKAFAGTELKGKKLGVIGLGAIGVLVANAATHLGMEVYGYDPYVSVDSAWRLSRNIHHAKTADEIYKECDYITIHVPAQSANIGLSDRIFTRVGASDDLASGQSTFMVEMTEVANILRNATSKSLLILDEIGRGTSTFDGLSIAWAVVEYISDSKLLGAKTLFATHYHELTELEGKIENVNNYCIAVKEKGDDIVFLRKIVKGGADKSYGIQVAKLAGVPDLVINRAKEIVEELSDEDITSRVSEIAAREHTAKKKGRSKKYDEVDIAQMSLFDTVKDDDVLNELKEIDVTNLTPIDALNTLYRLQNKLKNRW